MPTLFGIFLTVIFLLISGPAPAADNEPYRFVQLTSGSYIEFKLVQERIFSALDSLGLKGKYALADSDIYTPEKDNSPDQLLAIATEIMAQDDVDLIMSMGTDATKALLKVNNLKTPIIGIAISEPLQAGIIKTPETTGIPNFALRYIPNRGLKMFRTFHEVSTFFRMGLIYENTVEGRSYANLQDAREAGRDKGFAVVEYDQYQPDYPLESCEKAVNELIEKKIDAIYLSEISCFDPGRHDVSRMLHNLHDHGILTFASSGAELVSRGVFFGISTASERTLGQFYADMIIRILEQKETPGSIPIEAEYIPEIVLNMRAADDLGINLPISILVSSDKIFDNPISSQPPPALSVTN